MTYTSQTSLYFNAFLDSISVFCFWFMSNHQTMPLRYAHTLLKTEIQTKSIGLCSK